MAEENEIRGYVHVRDRVFATDDAGVLSVDKRSAFGRAHEETIREGITRFRDGPAPLSDKSSIHLTGNYFESKDGFESYFNHMKQRYPASPEIPFLQVLRPYIDDANNLPVVLAFATDRRVDKILERVGFIPLEARV